MSQLTHFPPQPNNATPQHHSPPQPPSHLRGWGKGIAITYIFAYLLLFIAIGFNLYYLAPEIQGIVPTRNDEILHLQNLQGTVNAIQTGQDPTDYWLGSIILGFPLVHHYQHLPYLVSALLYQPLQNSISLPEWLNWIRYLLLSFFPLSLYLAMRRLNFAPWVVACAGLLCSLIATNGLYGFEYISYVWRGYGMHTQLWGMFFMPMALANGYMALREGRGYFGAVALIAATTLSHLVTGYITFLSLGLLALLSGNSLSMIGQNIKRLALITLFVVIVISYFLLPYVLNSPYMNRSIWELTAKYDSYGYEWVINTLTQGELFDYERFPSLSILLGLGFALCVWRWHDEKYRIPVILFITWLALYFGRPTWGDWFDLLPLSRDLHLHRFIAGVHFGGMLLMGIGLALPWQWAIQRRDWRIYLALAIASAALLAPVYKDRIDFLNINASQRTEVKNALAAENKDLEALFTRLRQLPAGRVYAGRPNNWGNVNKISYLPLFALLQGQGFDMVGHLYHALSLNADVLPVFSDALPTPYNVFNARYVVAPITSTVPNFYTPLGDFGRQRLYQTPSSGYFDLVSADLAFVGDKSELYLAASTWLTSALPTAKQHPAIYFEHSPSTALPLAQASAVMQRNPFPVGISRGVIISESLGMNTFASTVNVTQDSWLMLKTSYHPNWHATVDGAEANITMLMPSYMGIKMTPGLHTVRLEYRPQAWRGLLMFFGLLVLAVLGFVSWRPDLIHWLKIHDVFQGRLAQRRMTQFKAIAAAHLPYLALLAAAIVLAGWSLLQFKPLSGHDATSYLPRNIEFYRGLKDGQWLPRWAPDLSGGYGEPLFNFNPPVIYYLSALFHSLGFGWVSSENLASLSILALAGFGMYGLAQPFWGRHGALVSAIAYVFAPYVLSVIYVRHALADFSILAFIPFAWWGLYQYAVQARAHYLPLAAAATALLMLSSNPVALISLPMLGLMLLIFGFGLRRWQILARGGLGLALGMGLSAFFWLPALLERDFVHTSRLLQGHLNYQNHFVEAWQLIHSAWGYGVSLPGDGDGMSFAIGYAHLTLALLALGVMWHMRHTRPTLLMMATMLIVFGIAAFMSLRQASFIWDRIQLLQYLEYAWRFLSLVAFSTAFLSGALLGPIQAKRAHLTALLSFGLILFNITHAKPQTFTALNEADFSPADIAARYVATTTALEYEPIWVRERPNTPAKANLVFVQGEGRIVSKSIAPIQHDYMLEISKEARLRDNTFYFPGWALYIDGVKTPIEVNEPYGLIEFALPRGTYTVKLVFEPTPIRIWASRLSWLALVGLLVVMVLRRRGEHG